jgi:hypothetical protein
LRSTTNTPVWVVPRCIRSWDDFEFETLEQMYSGDLRSILGQTVNILRNDPKPGEGVTFNDEKQFTREVLDVWTRPMVSDALSKTGELLEWGRLRDFHMARGFRIAHRLEPDWFGMRTNSRRNLLPGETKVSNTFKSSLLKDCRNYEELPPMIAARRWMKPIKQIFTYCMNTNSRYGYIITDKELCVFQVSVPVGAKERIQTSKTKNVKGKSVQNAESQQSESQQSESQQSESQQSEYQQPESQQSESGKPPREEQELRSAVKDGGIFQYKSVPWDLRTQPKESRRLTTNLALWWLHILSVNNGRLDWSYDRLTEEPLKKDDEEQSHDTEQERRQAIDRPASSQRDQTRTATRSMLTESFTSVRSLGLGELGLSSFSSTEPSSLRRSGRKRGRETVEETDKLPRKRR